MKKRLISMFLVLVMALGLFPISAFAASSTIGGALGEVNITNGGYKMSYLSMNGVVRSQSYTYFNFKSASGAIKEIPAYCINPTTKGVPQSVSPGESIKYIANEASNDPKIVGIIANGYPHRGLSELKLDNKYQAYYATKMALWCYLIDGWSIDRLTVNPSLSGVEKERGEKLLAAAKDIYKRGTWWNRVPQPIIDKIDSVTKQPLPGAQFKITTSDGSFVGNYGGTVASNGIYTTDSNGQIKLVDLKPDTYVVTEIKAPDGYVLDSTSQTVKVDRNDTQTLTFTNTPIGGGQIIKVDADSGERIKGVQFEIAKMNGERIGTYTTDSNGVITLPQLADGWYTATEIKAAKGYLLDSTPHNFEMKAGKTTSLTIENTQASSMLIHKIDSVTGKGIYGVTFLVSDSKGNPIGQYTSDQNGYVYIDKTLTDGKYLVREIQAADGYALDTTVKTFYVEYGGTSTITWKNTPITGQIQIVKKSADYNPTNGLPAETLLEGAVFEITDKAGNVVDTIRSNSRGLAVSKQLPLSRYFVREIKAPEHYGINDKELTAYLEYEGQILRFEVEDKSLSTGVAITKTGPKEIVAGQPVRYAFSGIANTSNVSLSNFYWRDTLPAQVRLDTVVTGTYNRPGTYKIVYRVNGGGHRTLADNLSTQKNYTLAASATALKLASNERVTEIMFVFGQAPAGFAQVEKPYLHCKAVTGLSAGSFVNVADVGGTYGGTWVQGISRWVTTVYGKPVIPTLPKTGY